jgi:putative transposase
MIDRNNPTTSVRRQCALLSLNRSSLYYDPRPASDLNERLMRRLDELYTAHPFLGYRKLTRLLQREGHAVNGKRVLRLLRRLGLQAIYPKPDTSKPHPKHPIYPYLLRNLAITGPGQVWATDITYIRLRRGFCYLAAVIDWYSRYVVSWRLSPTLESPFCVETLQAALAQGTPGIFNSDQGSQFTAAAFTDVLIEAGVRISMDGKGSYHDNIFTERFWRSVKYEEVYLKDYATIEQARAGLAAYIGFYNNRRPHQALAYQTPEQVHFALAPNPPVDMMDNASACAAAQLRCDEDALPTSPQAQQPQQPEIERAA